jgi:hypothetical protein
MNTQPEYVYLQPRYTARDLLVDVASALAIGTSLTLVVVGVWVYALVTGWMM